MRAGSLNTGLASDLQLGECFELIMMPNEVVKKSQRNNYADVITFFP